MKTNFIEVRSETPTIRWTGLAVLSALLFCVEGVDAWQVRGGGGGRAAGHANMARPSGGRPSVSRPAQNSRPSISHNTQRPNLQRPSQGFGPTRPAQIQRPNNQASLGNLSSGINRPQTGNNPNRPTTLPGRPGGSGFPNRPGAGAGQLPTRPGAGQFPNRPGAGGGGVPPSPKPNFRPDHRPDRPSIGGGGINPNRPNFPNRPGGVTPLPGRPGGIGNRPDRPNFSGNNNANIIGNRPNRPNIGGSNNNFIGNRPNFGGNTNIIGNRPNFGGNNIIGGGNTVINNNVNNINNVHNNIGIRPSNNQWNNWATNRPGWNNWGYGNGIGTRPWQNDWHDHGVYNHYHNWYHGAWHGNSSANWYSPFLWTGVGWCMSSYWRSGYVAYSNPYYVVQPSITPAYDYSQPININIDASALSGGATSNSSDVAAVAAPPEPSPEAQKAFESFDKARSAFERGSYASALNFVDTAIRQNGKDPILHEFRALCLFALGKYDASAAVLNSLLAVAPGWDWTTMSGLYGSTSAYEPQLRKLEQYCENNPKSSAPHFVLAYHYMVAGHAEEAIAELKIVTSLQPGDLVAAQMLASMDQKPESDSTTAAALPGPQTVAEKSPTIPQPSEQPSAKPPESVPAAPAGPTTNLVGKWKAARPDGSAIELQLTEVGGFEWKAVGAKSNTVDLAGKYNVDDGFLVLNSEKQGSMVGNVTSEGADKFAFIMVGGPPGDKGMAFERIK